MSTSAFGRNIKALRESREMTQQQFADCLSTTNITISRWETQGVVPRDRELIADICSKFAITETDLFGFSDGYYAKVHGLANSLVPETSSTFAPVLGCIAAGEPRQAFEQESEKHWVRPDLLEKHPDGFFLKVSGDSMDKLLPDGCYAFVAPCEVANNDIAAVKVNGDEATVKQVKFLDGLIILVPASNNIHHKRRVIDSQDPDAPDVRILGKVVWFDCEV